MEFCSGESLEKYLKTRNNKQGVNKFKVSEDDQQNLIDRKYNF